MRANRNGLSAAVAALLLLTGVPTAMAASAHISADAHERTGPGATYRVIRTLPSGVAVTLDHCQGSWCRIAYKGRRGWVSARYVNQGQTSTGQTTKPQPVSGGTKGY
jgi:uncharacterized protein YraI